MSSFSESQEQDFFFHVYAFVRTVPAGKVVTYGQVAGSLTDVSLTPRQVGAALRFAPQGVPWQRVVGTGGHLPINKRSPELKMLQHRLLEQEGVMFLPNAPDRVDMARCQWQVSSSEQGGLFDEDTGP